MSDPLHGSIFGHEPDPQAEHEPQTRRRRRGSSRRGGGRRGLVMLLALLVVAGGGFAAYTFIAPIVKEATAPKDYPGPGTGSVDVTVEQGASGRTIAKALVNADVVKSADAYLDAAGKNDKSSSIQPGVYTLRKQMKASDAVAALTDGKHRASSIVITPGMNAQQAFATMSKVTKVSVADYEKAAKNAAAIGLPQAAKGDIEGYLAPGTYDFKTGTSATDQLKKIVSEQRGQLATLGLTAEETHHVLVVASLVEKESGAKDFAKVARVIENRLADDMPLQLDSTVNYVQGESHIATSDEARASNSPYNTYKAKGLPPGPISNPGLDALKAAAKPEKGKWMYFVTINPCTHETLFAETYEEHQKNVTQFQSWLKAHPDRKCS